MSNLTDISTFASLTYQGYLEYNELTARQLPSDQQPRITPFGLAMLLIWEEKHHVWENLMHSDGIHLSSGGTFLEALVIYATIFGTLPPAQDVLDEERGVSYLFRHAQQMSPPTRAYYLIKPYPSIGVATYLYHIANRVVIRNEKPKSLIEYSNKESVYIFN